MRTLLMILALFALVCAGCGDKEDRDAAPASGVEKMKDAGGKKATETMDFACADPGCDKTKSGTLADPPS